MIKLKALTIAISVIAASAVSANSYTAIKGNSDDIKGSIKSTQQKISSSLSKFYQNDNSENEYISGLTTKTTQTELQPISLPFNCVDVSVTQETCSQRVMGAKKDVISNDGIMDNLDISMAESVISITRDKKNITTPTIPPVSEFYDRDIDIVTVGGYADSNLLTGVNGGFVSTRLSSLHVSNKNVSKKFPIFGCASGANAPMKFYNSDDQLIGSFNPSLNQVKFQSTDGLTPIDRTDFDEFAKLPYQSTYGYKGTIPNYLSFEVAMGETVYRSAPMVDYLTVSSVGSNSRIVYSADVRVGSDSSYATINYYAYSSSHSIWDKYCD